MSDPGPYGTLVILAMNLHCLLSFTVDKGYNMGAP